MTYCEECKDRLFPTDPTMGFYLRRTKQYFVPLCYGCPHQEELIIDQLKDRVGNLESISAQPRGIPRAYQDSLIQLQGQVVFLQNKLNAALDRGKKKADGTDKPATKKLGVVID